MVEIAEPVLRDAPPWAMQEMIEAEPELVRSILLDPALEAVVQRVAAAIRDAGDRPRISVVGCGSSDHAAMAIAALLGDAIRAGDRDVSGVRGRQAFEAALEPGTESVLIAVSHEGETPATLAAVKSSRAGLRVAVTANPDGPIGRASDAVLGTPLTRSIVVPHGGLPVAHRGRTADRGGCLGRGLLILTRWSNGWRPSLPFDPRSPRPPVPSRTLGRSSSAAAAST